MIAILTLLLTAAQPTDTMRLREVEVTAAAPRRDVIPVQTLEGEELHRLNSNSVADALRFFSGVQVKDYGGVGASRRSISARWVQTIREWFTMA